VPKSLFIAFYKYIDLPPLIFGLFQNTFDIFLCGLLGKNNIKKLKDQILLRADFEPYNSLMISK